MRKIVLSICAILLLGFTLSAQNQRVSGTVTDSDGSFVTGATVVLQGTQVVAVTGIDGQYSISVPADGILEISHMGMATQTVPVSGRTVINVVMEPTETMLEEVVITGYGVVRKVAFTGAAQAITGDVISNKTDPNFMKALQGSVTGLQMFNVSGQPGAFASVNIRGVGSVSSGREPLYVIDGMPMYSEGFSALSPDGNGATFASPMNNINADDIESVTVLKDATATAIYGSRAANGVIVITTKRGQEGAAKVNITAKKGFTMASYLDPNYMTVNTEKYLEIWGIGLENAGYSAQGEGLDDAKYYSNLYFGWEEGVTPDTNWLDAILRTGQVDEYSVSITGGRNNTNYFLSGGYMRNEGIVIGTGMNRYTLRANLENKGKILSFGLLSSASYSLVDNTATESQYINPLVSVYDLRPIEPVYNEDGSYNTDVGAGYNPVALADPVYGNKNMQRFITANINPYAMIDFGQGFYAKSSFAINVHNMLEDKFSGLFDPQGANRNGSGQLYNYTFLNLTVTNTVNWLQTFGNHNVNVMFGQEAQRMRDEDLYAWASDFPYPGINDLSTAANPVAASSSKAQSTLMSFFFNGEYDYKDRYFLSGSMRYDGSSRFGADTRWGLFYSIGGKYRISEEEFFEPVKNVISNLALRASYGTVGNQEIGWYTARGVFQAGYSYNSRPGAIVYRLPNDQLSWESRGKFNVGLDIGLFRRVNIEVDFYDEITSDMIFTVPISPTTGNSSIAQNVGSMRNTGVELLVNANILRSRDFYWNVNLNFTHNKNEITKLATQEPIIGTITIRQVGEAYHTFFMQEWAGVDPDTGAPLWYSGETGTETTSNYNEAGKRVVGKADPKFYGGFGTTVGFKGFDLSLDFSYSYGGKVFNSGFAYDMQVGDYFMGPVSNYVYENAWTPENTNTNVPKFVALDASNASEYSSRFLMDGSYLRLKSVVLGYNFPKALISRLRIDNARVFVSADNLFTVRSSDFIGFDPETRATGIQSWVYPLATTVMVGLQLGF